jgi:hypothetical protein
VSLSAPYIGDINTVTLALSTAPATDAAASLTTVGAVGRNGAAGNVSSATITSTNANAAGGNTLTLSANPTNTANSFFVGTGTDLILGMTAGTTGAYSYMTFGMWADCATNCGAGNETGVIGYYAYGQETPVGAIPATGSASYAGNTFGNYLDASNQLFGATSNVAVAANFTNRSLVFSTNNSSVLDGNGVLTAKADLNMSGTLTYGTNSNTFTGAVSDAGGRIGTATGRFFGPTANEVGGTYYVKGGGSTNIGAFVAK